MKTVKDNILLCEIPEWGCGYSRCEHIGFRMKDGYAGPYLCLKFNEQELKKTNEGWLVRCEPCANGGYSARGGVEAEITPIVESKPKKSIPNLLARDLQTRPRDLCLESQILWALEVARGPVTKSLVIKTLSGLNYPGYVEASYIHFTLKLKLAFENLIEEGFLKYTKGKPIEIIYL